MRSRYKALIFDMDGTLLDSMTCWRRITLARLGAMGYQIPEAFRGREMEISGHELAAATIGEDEQALSRFYAECEQAMIEQYPVLDEKPGALGFLRAAQAKGYRLCVATASPARNAQAALSAKGMLPHLEFVVTSRELSMFKWQPEFFERVAEMLGLAPADCLMFEDALYAIKAAKQAGMGVYAIAEPAMKPEEAEIRATADRFFTDYAELMGEL